MTQRELKNNPEIVIKKADKGSAIVIMNTRDYIAQCLDILNKDEDYEELDYDPSLEYKTDIKVILKRMVQNREITDATFQYLNRKHVRTARFYALPKIHKGRQHWVSDTRPPMRQIASANQSPTERISQFCDHFMNILMKLGKSYLKDTTDFLWKMHNLPPLPEGAFIVILDVEALYPSIPLQDGLEAVEIQLDKHRTQPGAKPSNDSIITLLEQVLTKNCLVFNGRHYRQVRGTAMGTKVAPAFANIYMNHFEEQHVYTYHIQPLVWLRFIDDIFSIWTCTREEIETFVDYISHREDTINFTATISDSQADFLDTTVKIHPVTRKVYTTLYTKPTDTHDYLLYSSAHPRHCKDNTPYSQLLRLRKICTLDRDFTEKSEMILAHFHRRGYPLEILKSAWELAKRLDRESLITPKSRASAPPNQPPDFYLTTTFNPASPNLKEVLKTHWDLISIPPYDLNINPDRVKLGHRRCPNLKEKLCSATISYPPPANRLEARNSHWDPARLPNENKCNTRNCRYCPILEHHGRVICHVTGRTYLAPKGVTCKSNNLVYLITCKKCLAQYVGETYRRLHKRMYEHLRDIETQKHTPVALHFNTPGHHISDIKFEVASFVYTYAPPDSEDGIQIRRSVEKLWIHRMRTNRFPGLNILD